MWAQHPQPTYISVGFLLVGVVPLIFFGAQRISALFATQNASIQQKHEPMAQSLAQAVYGYLLDQTSALQSTASQIESDNDSSIARLNDASFSPDHLNMELAAAHSAQPALLQLYVGNLAGRAVAAAPPAGVGVDYSVWNYVKDVLNPRHIGPKYSDVVRSRGDASVAAVVIAVPILDARRNLVGFLAGTVDLSEVQRLSNYSRIGQNGQAVVVDRRGRVIAHPREGPASSSRRSGRRPASAGTPTSTATCHGPPALQPFPRLAGRSGSPSRSPTSGPS